MIYFVAQTGVISDTRPLAPSNFYRYSFQDSFRLLLEEAVAGGEEGPHGLEWTPEDLKTFASQDTGEGDN